ncbi:hypothetical protein H4R33_004131, partial [Dimargaris cristalligena]
PSIWSEKSSQPAPLQLTASQIITDWDRYADGIRGLLTSEAQWNEASDLWYTLAPLETWDVYLVNFPATSKPPSAKSTVGQNSLSTSGSPNGGNSSSRPPSTHSTAASSHSANHRTLISLATLDSATLALKFPLAAQATGSMLADLLYIVPKLGETTPLNIGRVPANFPFNPQALLERKLDYAEAVVVIPIAVSRVITAGLWHWYRQGQWSEIQAYFTQAGPLGGPKSSAKNKQWSERLACIGQHARFITVLAALAQQNDHIAWLRDYVSFEYSTPLGNNSGAASYYQRLFIHELNHMGLAPVAEYLQGQWPETEAFKDEPASDRVPYLIPTYQWLDLESALFIVAPARAFYSSPSGVETTAIDHVPKGWGVPDYNL